VEGKLEVKMKKRHFLDDLTQVRNRRSFDLDLRKPLNDNQALALIDLDLFKSHNDKYGHATGDQIIVGLAKHLTDELGNDGVVYRIGGEEFAVLLPNQERESALFILENIRRSYVANKRTYDANGKKVELDLTFSVGLASYPDDADNSSDLLRLSDEALYRAKTTGRNKCCLARVEKMVPKTVHYTKIQLERLSALAKQQKTNEAILLREALDMLFQNYSTQVRYQASFEFEDILELSEEALQKLLTTLEQENLAIALKGASNELYKHFCKVLSDKSIKQLKEKMDALGSVRIHLIESLQQEIASKASKMIDEGKITLD
jgi:diguanylate cyclase (GGDEF)-like protein